MPSNLEDVLSQLREGGLLNDSKSPISNIKKIGEIVRCYTDDDLSEKRGWYILHQVRLRSGQDVLLGAYGIYHGDDSGTNKIILGKDYKQTPEDKAAFRKQLEETRKRQEADQKKQHEDAALFAEKVWRKLHNEGACDYLDRKGIHPFGIRYTHDSPIELSQDDIPKYLKDQYNFNILNIIPKNALAVPLHDVSGKIFGLQFIADRASNKAHIEKTGKDKQFFPPGISKKARFFMMGSPLTLGVILVAEGLATQDTLRKATDMAVAVCFDAGNIAPVVDELKKHWPRAKILICADDDRFSTCIKCKQKIEITYSELCSECGEPHGKVNTGINKALMSCINNDIRWVSPQFKDDQARFENFKSNKGKLTDFNDLYLTDGLHSVSSQIEAAINAYGWGGIAATRGVPKQGSGDGAFIAPIDTTDELLEKFWLVYGKGGMVFDWERRCLVTDKDVRDICRFRDAYKRWHESNDRKIVMPGSVGFDPGGKDTKIICNLWGGWPTQPKEGCCDALLELFLHMCSGEKNPVELADWGLKWHAYPIQNPGAKMQTSMVIHGPQGSGKNLWTEAVMAIFGDYGTIVDQKAIEDNYNDYLSKKLFIIADEVIARSELKHIKNFLKGLISNTQHRINPKFIGSYWEANHVNLVFLSNERIPVALEEDDRRYFVLWTPPPKPAEFYKKVRLEIDNGGIEALHHYLLNLPLGDFNEHSKPPMTIAKKELIDLGKESILRFYDHWMDGQIDGVPFDIPAPNEGVYAFYKAWCLYEGIRPLSKNFAMDRLGKIPGVKKERKEWVYEGNFGKKYFYFMPGCKEKDINDSEKHFFGKCLGEFNDFVKLYRIESP